MAVPPDAIEGLLRLLSNCAVMTRPRHQRSPRITGQLQKVRTAVDSSKDATLRAAGGERFYAVQHRFQLNLRLHRLARAKRTEIDCAVVHAEKVHEPLIAG